MALNGLSVKKGRLLSSNYLDGRQYSLPATYILRGEPNARKGQTESTDNFWHPS
jgi:hypothetical protein